VTSRSFESEPGHGFAYLDHLRRVSRSFAICIPILREPLRSWVGLAYLLCRVLDTIEDSSWTSPTQQAEAFVHFERFMRGYVVGETVARWAATFPRTLPQGERALVDDAPRLFDDLRRLPLPVREAVTRAALGMERGMRHFIDREGGHRIVLRDMVELNQYCFFVAGIVGEMLTELLVVSRGDFPVTQTLLLHAHRFGRFLQKVNVLKDQIGDEAAHRWLIPSPAMLRESLRGDALAAREYLRELPRVGREYRLFCAYSLFLGMDVVDRGRPFEPHSTPGPSGRDRTQALLSDVDARIDDEDALDALFADLVATLPSAPEQDGSRETARPAPWLTAAYEGALDEASLARLVLG
jgi:phytoene/squalene synthetase